MDDLLKIKKALLFWLHVIVDDLLKIKKSQIWLLLWLHVIVDELLLLKTKFVSLATTPTQCNSGRNIKNKKSSQKRLLLR